MLKTPNNVLALREGPGVQYKVRAKLVQGDLLYADNQHCLSGSDTCRVDPRHPWVHVTSVARIDGAAAERNTEGWVAGKFIQDFHCPE